MKNDDDLVLFYVRKVLEAANQEINTLPPKTKSALKDLHLHLSPNKSEAIN